MNGELLGIGSDENQRFDGAQRRWATRSVGALFPRFRGEYPGKRVYKSPERFTYGAKLRVSLEGYGLVTH